MSAITAGQFLVPIVVTETNTITVEAGTPTVVITGQMSPPSSGGSMSGAFMVSNRFGEIAYNPIAVQAAQQNLGLYNIDGGTFF